MGLAVDTVLFAHVSLVWVVKCTGVPQNASAASRRSKDRHRSIRAAAGRARASRYGMLSIRNMRCQSFIRISLQFYLASHSDQTNHEVYKVVASLLQPWLPAKSVSRSAPFPFTLLHSDLACKRCGRCNTSAGCGGCFVKDDNKPCAITDKVCQLTHSLSVVMIHIESHDVLG